jgi:hypothetical protein
LKEFLPDFDAVTLLKLAYKLREGRAIQFIQLKKMHEEMPAKLENLAFQNNPQLREKIIHLRKLAGDENFYLGFSFVNKHETREVSIRPWFLISIPDKNVIIVCVTAEGKEAPFHFFRIIMEQGDPKEKIGSKILEIEQSMLLFRFDFAPISKDRRELQKTKYRTAIKKLSFLRLLRKSYLGKTSALEMAQFKEESDRFFNKATIGQNLQVNKTPGLSP